MLQTANKELTTPNTRQQLNHNMVNYMEKWWAIGHQE
uniref:Uncharacterized protein n=1 Tax=Anguilla anguilla TaxID=7936 RepID=A0A0E9TUY3_ANGAN